MTLKIFGNMNSDKVSTSDVLHILGQVLDKLPAIIKLHPYSVEYDEVTTKPYFFQNARTMRFKMNIGRAIKLCRTQKNMKQSELAILAKISTAYLFD